MNAEQLALCGLGIVIGEVIQHLLGADGVTEVLGQRREGVAVVYELTEVGVGCGVHVGGEGGDRRIRNLDEAVFLEDFVRADGNGGLDHAAVVFLEDFFLVSCFGLRARVCGGVIFVGGVVYAAHLIVTRCFCRAGGEGKERKKDCKEQGEEAQGEVLRFFHVHTVLSLGWPRARTVNFRIPLRSARKAGASDPPRGDTRGRNRQAFRRKSCLPCRGDRGRRPCRRRGRSKPSRVGHPPMW